MREPKYVSAGNPAVTWLPKMLALSYIFYIQKHNPNTITDKCSSLAKFRLLVGEFPGLYCASTSKTSLLTGLSSSEPLLVNTVTDRT